MFDLMPLTNPEKNIFRYFDDLERSFFRGGFTGTSQFRTDIVDAGDKYVLSAELPGFAKDEIKIDIDADYLTISAEHKEENEVKEENFVRRERTYGSFARRFDVSNIETDAIRAKYENGILSLDLPKRGEPPVPPARQIEIQ